MAKFAYNNMISATTSITLFFALYRQHPRYIIRNKPTGPAKTIDLPMFACRVSAWYLGLSGTPAMASGHSFTAYAGLLEYKKKKKKKRSPDTCGFATMS